MIKKKWQLSIWLLVYLLFEVLPYVYGFPHIFTILHDNLENDVIRLKLLAESGKMWAANDAIIPNMMGGLPRISFNSALYYFPWLFYFFQPYYAYIINVLLIHTVGFFGVYYLSKKFIDTNEWFSFMTVILLSLMFSYQLEYPNFGLSLALTPWLLAIVVPVKEEPHRWKWWYYAVVGLYPFLTMFTHYGFFLIIFLGIYSLYQHLYLKRNVWYLWGVVVYLSIFYLVAEYRLVLGFGGNSFVSHRSEFNLHQWTGYAGLKKFVELLLYGYYQCPWWGWGIVILFLWSVFMLARKEEPLYKDIVFFVFVFTVFSAMSVFYNTIYFKSISDTVSLFKMLDLSRFYTVLQGIVLLIFILLSAVFIRQGRYSEKIILMGILLIGNGYYIKHNQTFKDFVKKVLPVGKPEINNPHHAYLDEFYAEDLYVRIQQKLNKPLHTFRVGSVGLYPATALFNGFYTIDGVIANYPLSYKKTFRKIIEKELEKNHRLKDYFDNYGNRVGLFSAELIDNSYLFKYDTVKYFRQLELDTRMLKELGCRYIFSARDILNADKLHWKKLFEVENNTYRIVVYEVD